MSMLHKEYDKCVQSSNMRNSKPWFDPSMDVPNWQSNSKQHKKVAPVVILITINQAIDYTKRSHTNYNAYGITFPQKRCKP